MEVRAAFVAVAVGTSFVVACGQPLSPTSPASVSSSGPSSRNLTDHTLPPDVSETVFNPCTGSTTTLTAHFLSFVFRLDDDPAGGEHYTLTGVVQFSTTDGFSGRGTFHDSGTRYPGQSGIEIDIEVMSQTAGNGTGQRVVVHGVVQRVRRDGVPVVYFENFSLECVGKPVA